MPLTALLVILFLPFAWLTPDASTPPVVPESSLGASLGGTVLASMAPTLPLPKTFEPDAPRVGIQVGHWNVEEHPAELAHLRESYGAEAAGYSEVDVNLEIAWRVVKLLWEAGVDAELLPATVPPSYRADAFVSIHADGGPGAVEAGMRGFKLATSRAAGSQRLAEAVARTYAARTRLPEDDHITEGMSDYYAFNTRKFAHSVSTLTPAIILEMGFLTSARDRELLIDHPDRVARGIAEGILRFLEETE